MQRNQEGAECDVGVRPGLRTKKKALKIITTKLVISRCNLPGALRGRDISYPHMGSVCSLPAQLRSETLLFPFLLGHQQSPTSFAKETRVVQ